MKKYISILLVIVTILSLLAGCSRNKEDTDDNGGNTVSGNDSSLNSTPVDVDFSKSDADMFTERDGKTEYDESKAVFIKLNGTSATSSSDSVKISGSTVTITEEATYVISGTLTDV